jgi:formylglycine-generating enzyme required for sulfatase activity
VKHSAVSIFARAAPILAALLSLAVGVPVPELAAAESRRAASLSDHAPSTPQARAFTLGMVTLRAPASEMILVPRSTFVMGSTPTDVIDAAIECGSGAFGERCKETVFANEMPQHRVTLSAYWLDRTEVTVEAYRRCAQLGRCRPAPFEEGGRRFDVPGYPVSLVSWDDARDYCSWRGARLPTEAEFERAARGVQARRYPWGRFYNSRVANHGRLGFADTDASDGHEELAPVGSYPSGRTPDGFLDLAGNVAEWIQDRYFPSYPEGHVTDPQGPPQSGAQAGSRLVRGGHFSNAAPWLRGAARVPAEPAVRRPYIGFRCARSHARTARVAKPGDGS